MSSSVNAPRRRGARGEHVPQSREVVPGEGSLRESERELEEQDVPALSHLLQVRGHRFEVPRVRCVEDRQALESVAVMHREPPRDDPTPVVTDDVRSISTEVAHELLDVSGQRLDSIVRHGRRLVGQVVPAHVRRDDVHARVGEDGDLMAPRVPEIGKTVQQQHQRSLFALGRPRLDVVQLHRRELSPSVGPGLAQLPASCISATAALHSSGVLQLRTTRGSGRLDTATRRAARPS